jgi:hypothetical protein
VLAVAAIAVPAAQADTSVTIPEELSGRQYGPSGLSVAGVPDELSGREFGPAAFTSPAPVGGTAVTDDNFDLGDAGIGAGIAAGVALAVGAAALVAGRRRGRLIQT